MTNVKTIELGNEKFIYSNDEIKIGNLVLVSKEIKTINNVLNIGTICMVTDIEKGVFDKDLLIIELSDLDGNVLVRSSQLKNDIALIKRFVSATENIGNYEFVDVEIFQSGDTLITTDNIETSTGFYSKGLVLKVVLPEHGFLKTFKSSLRKIEFKK